MKEEILSSLTHSFKLMPVYRAFLPQALDIDETFTLEKEEWKHLYKVLRVSEGDHVSLTDGFGTLMSAKVLQADRDKGLLQIIETHKEKPPKRLVLCQALLRSSKLDWIVEKATEIGVTDIELFSAEKGEIRELSKEKQKRLQNLLISALKQSGNLYLPQIHLIKPIASWNRLEGKSYYGALTEAQKIPLKSSDEDLRWIVGPESGFSKKEEKALKKLGVEALSLGKMTLRAETAAVVGLGIIAYFTGELGG